MSDQAASEKEAYFQQQALLDLSDDETDLSEGFLNVKRAIEDSRVMPPPPSLVRQRSSFLGPTPREKRAEFEAYTSTKRANSRPQGITRSATDPKVEVASSFPSANPKKDTPSLEKPGKRKKLKHTTSLPDLVSAGKMQEERIPFYQRVGVVPRELRSGKNTKLADDIQLLPEGKQLLRGKIIYFYPSDDISIPRRRRIHKVIQLGAAWVNTWRDDINYIMMDDDIYTYSTLIRHLKKLDIPRTVTLVKFDPYVPQCIEFGLLLDPAMGRFVVKGAPRTNSDTAAATKSLLPASQSSLKVKPSRRELVHVHNTPIIDSISVEDSFPPPPPPNQPERSLSRSESGEEHVETKDAYNDALSEAIQQAKATAHLPLDEDSDSENRGTCSANQDSDSSTDVESPKVTPRRSKASNFSSTMAKTGTAKGFNPSGFQCMEPGGTDSSQNPNARTIEVLQEMGKYYDQMQDQWRTLAYRKAVNTLKKHTTKITTKEEAFALPQIGTRLAEKIEEIVFTNSLQKLDNTRKDPTDKVLRLFLGVYGAGLSQANKWIQQGYTTLEDLIEKAKLTESQKIGVEHYSDFATRIPRAEVEAHGAFMRNALQKMDSGFQAEVMGSYRRGAKDSSDIDVMITKPGASIATIRSIVFEQLVPQLFAQDFLKVKLATSSRMNDGTKWFGASCLPGSTVWRRLDLLIAPEEEMGAALIYFTGNDIFNRSLRLLASKKGMRLNHRGLYKHVIRGKDRKKITDGTLVEGRDERKIFEVLGVPWWEPNERIC